MAANKEKKQHVVLFMRKFIRFLIRCRQSLNQRMNDHLSDVTLAGIASALAAVILFFLLFRAPYLGVANDGTITKVMQDAGLMYRVEDAENANLYFTRVYQVTHLNSNGNVQMWLIRFAKLVDELFTRDQLFDIRFLGAIYSILFLPAFFLTVKSAVERVEDFSEKALLLSASVIMFSDVAYLTYFNSLYAEPIYYICLLYIAASAMSLQRETRFQLVYYLLILVNTWFLCLTRRHCCFIGLVMGIFYYLQYYLKEKQIKRTRYLAASLLIMAASFTGLMRMPSDFDQTSKLHSMTRGVLLQSDHPVNTLKAFGIEGSYSVLADVSLYDKYPLVEISNPLLQTEFLNQYDTKDVLLYYLRHPKLSIGMLDLAVRSSFQIRKDYCGNYERSAGRPELAKSIAWSAYSTYKIRSAPKTLGYVLLLIAAYCLMMHKRCRVKGRLVLKNYVYLTTMVSITVIGILHILLVMIHSGDAQLIQFHFILGLCIDLLSLYVGSELLHKLNIFTHKGD